MDNNKILNSFKFQDGLNSKIWQTPRKKNIGDSESHEIEMKPEVREKLLEIADIFFEFLNIDVVVTDIIMIGSLTNYNWSEYSDIDLHLVVDYSQFDKKTKKIFIEFFDLKKIIFNIRHNIKLFGFDVECFVQDEKETTFSSGIYSILHNEWLNFPKKEKNDQIDFKLINEKANQWMRIIDNLIDNSKNENVDNIKKIVKKYKEKLKKFRNCGLQKNGEMSVENLVFKLLRRNGYIEKLYELPIGIIDKKLSMSQ